MPETINVKPSARILKVLGDIEFEGWQCLAELIDNSFDDFLNIKRSGTTWSEGFRVNVTLPLQSTPVPQAEIVVLDNGRGMSLGTLNDAVRAGWSSNDPFNNLGLFGMGFNVATARLGKLARVLTTRVGETEWVGVSIDLDAIRDDFDVPVIREPKNDPAIHGTKVVVSRLDPVRAGWLGRNASAVRGVLGGVYSYLLAEQGFELLVNGVIVTPHRACRWGNDRSVTYGSGSSVEQIPAYVPIDQVFPPAETCLKCRNWQPPGRGTCVECGSSELVERVRRIHGWLGIQRFLHRTNFGIDFFRNGRKILRSDKRLFEWQDTNRPVTGAEVEYPVELGQGGRIIGEIHLDHVPVNYQKNAFEWSDRNWIAAAAYLRGEGPLLPQKARRLGLPPNDSFLARLHRGYRRNDPGYRYLIPGDENGPIHEKTREWGERFQSGDPEFQSDQRWWDAVVFFEDRRAGVPLAPQPPESVLAELGLDASDPTDGAVPSQPPTEAQPVPPRETEQQRIARYRSSGRQVPSLTGEFGMPELGANVRLSTFEVRGARVEDSNSRATPVLFVRQPGNSYAAFIDAGHELFQSFGDDPAEYVLLELADNLRTRAESTLSLSQIVAAIKARHLSDRRLDPATLAGQARELLRTVREKMVSAIRSNPERAWQFLTPDERVLVETTIVSESAGITLDQARETGDFVLYAPPLFLSRLVEEWPEAFMDGRIFAGPYETVTNPQARRISLGKVVSYLSDVGRLATVSLPMQELVRAKLSMVVLAAEVSQPDVVPA